MLRVARFCSYNFSLIHKDVENLKLRIAVVGTDHLQIYFLPSQDMQIITSANICIGRIDQSKTFLEKDWSHFSRGRGQGNGNIIILWPGEDSNLSSSGFSVFFFFFFHCNQKSEKSTVCSTEPILLSSSLETGWVMVASDGKWRKLIPWERKVNISKLKCLFP